MTAQHCGSVDAIATAGSGRSIKSTKMIRWMLLGAVVVGIGLSSQSADASHYRIEYLDLFTAEQVAAMDAIGIVGTDDFLVRAQTPDDRLAIGRDAGLSELEVLVFARLCELLQVEGVGPRAAQLLRVAGVVGVEDLASRDPAELLERVIAVNAVERITGIDPALENLQEWISSARNVPYHLQ